MRRQDWGFGLVSVGLVATIANALGGALGWTVVWAGITAVAALATRRWSRLNPGPMPHSLSWILDLPHPFHSTNDLRSVLAPKPGEHVLEIGPGIGYHSLPIAQWLTPDGTLEVLDVQQPMLDELQRRARDRGIDNVVAQCGSAEHLPYPDASFDAAYLMTVLGEIPNQQAAIAELRRVLKPHGRLLIGEFCIDPDFVAINPLRELMHAGGFRLEHQHGRGFAYIARFAVS